MRLRADGHLHQITLAAERVVQSEDFRYRLVGRPDDQMAARTATLIELRPRERRPAALAPDAAHRVGIGREKGLDRGLCRVRQETVAIDSEGESVRRGAGATGGLAVERRQRRKARRLAADDRERERQAERAGASDRLRRAAGGDPDRQRPLKRARVDALTVERRPMSADPR